MQDKGVSIYKLDFRNIRNTIVILLLRKKKFIKSVVDLTLKYTKKKFKKHSITVILCSDKKIKELNKKYLKRNKITDVLCFRYNINTADIFVSVQRAFYQAKKYKQSFIDELSFLIIHGVLHFLGYNDNTLKKRNEMLTKQEKILKLLKK